MIRVGVGILKAATEDYENGYVWTLKERVHADVFDDYSTWLIRFSRTADIRTPPRSSRVAR